MKGPLILLLTSCILLISCSSDKIQIQIESGKGDNTGYIALLSTLHSSGVRVDTLTFTKIGETFSYTFDRDSLYEAYIVVGQFDHYYPLDLNEHRKVRFHLDIASPHNCYDLDIAKRRGYSAFLKEATAPLRSYDKALADKDYDNASKYAKLVTQLFTTFATNLKDNERSRYKAQMDWAVEIMSLYPGGITQLRQALLRGTIDSTLFSSEVYRHIIVPYKSTTSDYLTLQAINKNDTILWQAQNYPEGSILFGSNVNWSKIQMPRATRQAVSLILPLSTVDTLSQIANMLDPYSYIVDAPEPLRIQLYRSLSPDKKAGVIHYRTDSNQRLIIDSISYFRYK